MIAEVVTPANNGVFDWCPRIDTDQCPTVRQPIYDYRTAVASAECRPGRCHPGRLSPHPEPVPSCADSSSVFVTGSVLRVDLELGGHVVLVVGGTGLIGRAIVARLRAEGATAIAGSRHAADGITLDAQDPDSVTAALDGVLEQHGRLDSIVVAAAPSAHTLDASRHADPEQVLHAIDAKAMSFLRLANAALPIMSRAGYGRIVGVSGQHAFLTGNVTGSVRNAALIIAAKNRADAVAGSGVTVNTVNPGTVSDTPATEVEIGRGGESSPEQIADLVAFLVSPRAAGISGESIAVGHRVRGVTSM